MFSRKNIRNTLLPKGGGQGGAGRRATLGRALGTLTEQQENPRDVWQDLTLEHDHPKPQKAMGKTPERRRQTRRWCLTGHVGFPAPLPGTASNSDLASAHSGRPRGCGEASGARGCVFPSAGPGPPGRGPRTYLLVEALRGQVEVVEGDEVVLEETHEQDQVHAVCKLQEALVTCPANALNTPQGGDTVQWSARWVDPASLRGK